jgi:hypothetical protein
MLVAQLVIDAERPGFQIREDAMDPQQHDMSGHDADKVSIAIETWRGRISSASIRLNLRALRHIGGDETMQRRLRTSIPFRDECVPGRIL